MLLPFPIGTLHLDQETSGIFGADPRRVFGQFLGDFLDALSLRRQVPHRTLKLFGSLALGRAALDQIVIICDDLLRPGIVEIENILWEFVFLYFLDPDGIEYEVVSYV